MPPVAVRWRYPWSFTLHSSETACSVASSRIPTYSVIWAVPGREYLEADPTAVTPRNPAAICWVNQPAARGRQPTACIGSRSAASASALPLVTAKTIGPEPAKRTGCRSRSVSIAGPAIGPQSHIKRSHRVAHQVSLGNAPDPGVLCRVIQPDAPALL